MSRSKLESVSSNCIYFTGTSDAMAEVRTNESCQQYSEACLELCREMDIKAIDLWTAIQKKDGWATACFT